jgi:sugar transferase (PEP-CTERM/EpsH1 system associated)
VNLCVPDNLENTAANRKPNLLMVAHRVPHPPNKGERIRTWNMLRELSHHFAVYLACPVDTRIQLDTWKVLAGVTEGLALEPVDRLGRWVTAGRRALRGRSLTEGLFHSHSLADIIRRWMREHKFAAGLAVCSSVAEYLVDLPLPLKVIDLIDVDSAKWSAYARRSVPPRRWIYQMEAARLGQYERYLARVFDHVTVTTDHEAALLGEHVPDQPIHVVPNGVDLEYFDVPAAPHLPVAVFTGALNYRPNVDGLVWLVNEVWPQVRSAVPGAVLRIVGRDPVERIRRLGQCPGVDMVGPVDDVRTYLSEAATAVVPVWLARGVQNKVLEAMAAGKPVITTPDAAQGVGACDGEHCYVAQHADQWAGRLITLLSDRASGQQVARQGRQFVEQTRNWEHCLQPLMRLLGRGDRPDGTEVLNRAA